MVLPWRNLTALAFSLFCFAWGEGSYVVLLLGTITANYLIGQHLDASNRGKWLLGLGVATNLGVLFYYKYFGFLIGSVLGLPLTAEEIPHLPVSPEY